jgi:hypothetical protein
MSKIAAIRRTHKKVVRLTEDRKTALFRAFLAVVSDLREEVADRDHFVPAKLRKRVFVAVNSRLPCTRDELSLMIRDVIPMMELVVNSHAAAV